MPLNFKHKAGSTLHPYFHCSVHFSFPSGLWSTRDDRINFNGAIIFNQSYISQHRVAKQIVQLPYRKHLNMEVLPYPTPASGCFLAFHLNKYSNCRGRSEVISFECNKCTCMCDSVQLLNILQTTSLYCRQHEFYVHYYQTWNYCTL